MSHPPAGRFDRDWEATPPAVRVMMVQLIAQVEALSDKTFFSRALRNLALTSPASVARLEPPSGSHLVDSDR